MIVLPHGAARQARWAMGGLALASALAATSLAAEVPDSAQEPAAGDSALVDTPKRAAAAIRWYEVATVVGGVAVLSVLDEPIQRFAQRHRSKTMDDISGVFRQGGEPIYYAGVSVGTLAAGIVIGNASIRRAGGRMTVAVALSGAASFGLQRLVGRSRPNEGVGAYEFHPFNLLKDSAGLQARGALPSGHVTAAFAMATSLADDVHNDVVDVVLYILAAGTAFSRINDDRHWFSDTAMGAALGITMAKLVNGQLRILNLRPPAFLVTPAGAPALSWNIPFGPVRDYPPSVVVADGQLPPTSRM